MVLTSYFKKLSFGLTALLIITGCGKASNEMSDLKKALDSVSNDTSIPTVAITKKTGQATITNALPIEFTVTFSKAIDASTFTTAILTNTGTAAGITWNIVAVSSLVYTVQVTATGAGTLIPQVPANSIADTGGRLNSTGASTSMDTVTYSSIGAFTISGVESSATGGGTDVTVDANLSNGQLAKISWAASAGATSYNVTVFEDDGTTVKCAQQNTASLNYDFSACSLSYGTYYKARVASVDGSANEFPATNSLYRFFVNYSPTTVTNITSTSGNGTYKLADVIPVTVTFSRIVTVTGTPQLTLALTPTNRTVNYSSGSGTTTLIFNYTVQSGDTSADLDYLSTSALALNGGTIVDTYTNNADLTLVAPGVPFSLGHNKALVIDTTPPSISVAAASANEGSDLTFTVTQSATSNVATTFSYASSNGTASSGTNYTSVSSTGTISAGSTSTTVTVHTIDDNVARADLTMTLTMSSPSNATLGTASATGTIVNTNAPTITSIAPSSGAMAGGTSITITGTGFLTGVGVTVGGAACTSVVVTGTTQIVCSTPSSASSGAANVIVTNTVGSQPHGTATVTSTGGFTYNAAPASLTISPASLSLITGESSTLTASAGTPAYSWSDVAGYINAASGILTVPINATAQTDVVTATDSLSVTGTRNVGIRAFQTKDSYSLNTNSIKLSANKFAADPTHANTVFAVGTLISTNTDSIVYGAVVKSANNGTTWSVADKNSGNMYSIAVDNAGKIFAAGSNGTDRWMVKRSTDGGSSWSAVDDYGTAVQSNAATDIAIDNTTSPPTVYVSGYNWINGGHPYLTVRKSTNSGSTWSTLTSSTYTTSTEKSAHIVIDTNTSPATLYVASTTESSQTAEVRKSTDGGSSWSLIASYNTNNYSTTNNYIAIDTNSNPSILYMMYPDQNTGLVEVRKTTDQGSSWSAIDSYVLDTGGGWAVGTGLAVDLAATPAVVYHTSFNLNSDGSEHVVVRKSTNSGGAWSDVYDSTSLNHMIALFFDHRTSPSTGYGFIANAEFNTLGQSEQLVALSTNNGASWSTSAVTNIENTRTQSVSIAVDTTTSPETIYTLGYEWDTDRVSRWFVRKSTDNGTSWSVVLNDTQYAVTSIGNLPSAIAVDTNTSPAAVYISGWYGVSPGGQYHWVIRKSSDQGATWSSVSDYTYGVGSARAESMVIDTSSNPSTIFVAGSGIALSHYSWVVRKSTDGGATWSNVDDYQYVASSPSRATTIAVDTSASPSAVYVGGYVYPTTNGSDYGRWQIRKSTDGGSSWTTVDTFAPVTDASSLAKPSSIAFDTTVSPTRILVAGMQGFDNYNISSTTGARWIVRSSADSGSTWNTVDSFEDTSGYASKARSIAISGSKILVTGQAADANGYHWHSRLSKDAGATWVSVDKVTNADDITGYRSLGTNIVPCGTNQFCLSGSLASKFTTRILSP